MRLALVFVATAALVSGKAGALQTPAAGAARKGAPTKTAMVVYLDANGDVLAVQDSGQKSVTARNLKSGDVKNVDLLDVQSHEVIKIREAGMLLLCYHMPNCQLYCVKS